MALPALRGVGPEPLAGGPAEAERFPLSPGQTERWLAASLGREARIALNESACLLLTGAIDLPAFEATVLEVLARHDSFRMRFDADEPAQFIDPSATPALQRVDLRDQADAEAALDRFCRDAVRHDFELHRAPLARFSLLQLADGSTAFHLVYSHLVCDGWSVRSILSEVAKIYRARTTGQTSALRGASTPGQFVQALRARWNGPDGAASTAFWREAMRQPPEPLPLGDLAPPAARRYGAATLGADVEPETTARLQAAAQRHGVTLFPVILAAMAMALQRRTGREDFAIAIPFASQTLVRGPTVVADGAIDLPVRIRCHADDAFDDVLARVHERVTEALKHPFVTQVSVAREVGARSLGNRAPLTGILCNMLPRVNTRSFEPLEARAWEGVKSSLLGELLFNFHLEPETLNFRLHYSTDFFSGDRAALLVADLLAVFREIDALPSDERRSGGSGALDPWVARLSPLPPPLELPTDQRRPAVLSGRSHVHSVSWPADQMDTVLDVATQLRVPVAALFLAAFGLLLHRISALPDIVLGLQGLGGAATLPLRLRLDESLSVGEWVAHAHALQAEAEAAAHAELSVAALVRRLDAGRDPSRAPLHQASFCFADTRHGPAELPPPPAAADTQDLAVQCLWTAQGLACRLAVNADVIDPPTAALFAQRLQSLVGRMAARPGASLATLDVLAPNEWATLAEWNATAAPWNKTWRVHDLIGAQVARSPLAIALTLADQPGLTYAELARRSNRLARLLRTRGLSRGALVGLCVDRSPAMVVAQLAVLKAGAAYVPLDPTYPTARLSFMAGDAGLSLLLTDAASRHALPWTAGPAIDLDADAAVIDAQDATELPPDPTLDARAPDAAYVIYTSGSTGKPKGVIVPHGAVVNFLQSMARRPGLVAADRLLAVTTLSFDIAVLELLLPLSVGARVVIADRRHLDSAELRGLLERSGATVMQATPGTWRMLIDAGWPGSPGFKGLIGGEPLPQDLAAALLDRGVELWNLYGPTETTVWSTCWRVGRPLDRISVGTPIANTLVQVLDEAGRLCPIGVPGELCIGGAGVALGYLNRAELTAERFVADAASGSGGRLYRTGDRGRWRPDGQLEHLGRLDSQVKMRGHRIELGEIETVLAAHEGVARCVLMVREDTPGDQRLVAYVVPRGAMPAASALREHLAAQLPHFMLPQHVVKIAAVPLLPNGKIDRSSLPRPSSGGAVESAAAADELRTPTQQAVWEAWRDLLGLERFSVHDNFFDLGGHSLLAMTLVSRLKKQFDAALTLNSILQAPTVALLARLIDGEGVDHDSLLSLRAGGHDAPVFLVHDASGETLIYRSLALRLPAEVPVYALRPLAGDGLAMLHTRIEDMAAHYIQRIRSVQPEGPYRLGGLCSGGVVAFEMALQLQRAGQGVSLLALIEASDPMACPRRGRFAVRQLKGFAGDFAGKASGPRPTAALRAMVGFVRRLGGLVSAQLHTRIDWARSYRDAKRLRASLDKGLKPAARLQQLTPPQIHLLAQSDYRNREVYRGDVLLFRATKSNGIEGDEPFVELFADPLLGWKRSVAGAIECIDVPGGHFSTLAEPHVQALAAAVQARIGPPSSAEGGRSANVMNTPSTTRLASPRPSMSDDVATLADGSANAVLRVLEAARTPAAAGPERAAWYRPSADTVAASQLTEFAQRLSHAAGRPVDAGLGLHPHTVAEFRSFWAALLDWAALRWEGDAARVCVGDECETAVFFPDLRLNYAENVLQGRQASPNSVAVTSVQHGGLRRSLTRADLARQVEALAQALRGQGIAPGDRLVAILRNDADAVVVALAVAAVGASLACATPEMGAEAIVERFAPLEPRLLLAHGAARAHDTGVPVAERIARVAAELPSLAMVLTIDDATLTVPCARPVSTRSALIAAHGAGPFEWRRFDFNQPLFIMASSGTTGKPKCIVHGAGGTLIEHVKEHRLHGDLRSSDKMFFQTSCAWMMWQWQLSALASCGEIVLYDGPVQDARTLWRIVAEERVTVFGTSPAYLKFSQDAGVVPRTEFELGALRAILSTGAILYDSQYAWIRDHVASLPVQSISGGTDIIGCFVLGNPNLPVYAGESQCRSLGMDVRAAALEGSLPGASAIGELVCANPFPSRPLGFFGDDGSRFHASYFAANPGLWTHGDLIEFTAQGSARIHGRSDGVLNVRGIRVGPAEIYKVLREFSEVRDAMVVEQRVPAEFQDGRAVLFLVLDAGVELNAALAIRIRRRLAEAASPAHVPDAMVKVAELPYTHSGKPSEAALSAAVNRLTVRNARALRNPACLDGVADLPALQPAKADESDAVLARDDPERYLCRVWERSFGFAPIGLDDDFFDMGGHSLMAARMMAEVGGAMGRELPVATLLQASTIRRLAAVMRDPSWTPTARLISLRAGQGQPYFLIHSLAGTLLEMWAVLRALTNQRPVYGVQARGLEDGQEPHLRVPEMASEYIGFIRQVQPHGPYSIGGYSFGGLVAFEIACQLQRAGEKVDLLTVIDAQVDGRYLPARQQWRNLVRRMAERVALFRSLGGTEQRAYLRAKALVFADRCRQGVGLAPRHPELVGNIVVEAQHPPALRRIRGAMLMAMRAYAPPTYPGRVVFIRPETPGADDPLPVWQRTVKGGLVLETTPGDHATLITGSNAVALAKLMSRHLSAASASATG